VQLIGDFLREIGTAGVLWLLDSPVSNSGCLKTLMRGFAESSGWDWEIKLVLSPNAELKRTERVVATSGSVALDDCQGWVNLAAEIIERRLPSARVIDLAEAGG
jgi:hypothetical protein